MSTPNDGPESKPATAPAATAVTPPSEPAESPADKAGYVSGLPENVVVTPDKDAAK